MASARAKGLSPRTIKGNYIPTLQRVFLPWCESEGITTAAQLDQEALDRFSTKLQTEGGARGNLSKESVYSYVKVTKALLTWIADRGYGVTGKPQLPKLPRRRLVDILTREEIDRMEAAARSERDKLIIRLLANTHPGG